MPSPIELLVKALVHIFPIMVKSGGDIKFAKYVSVARACATFSIVLHAPKPKLLALQNWVAYW